tara:strand:+ start:10847 stop:11011 length:165 start_codon:yes stop_codon:yes gene_type:complete
MKSNWKTYSKTLPLATKIYYKIYGDAKTHAEWANSFNIIGDINLLIIEENRNNE